MDETWRKKVVHIHEELATIHNDMGNTAQAWGLSDHYIAQGIRAIKLEKELSAVLWELLGLKERSTSVPLLNQLLTPKIEG
jgi:hypothetical protein